MVFIDFYYYQEEVKRALVNYINSLNDRWDPFMAAWISYAVSIEGTVDNFQFNKLYKRLLEWLTSKSEEIWEQRRNFGPIAFTLYLYLSVEKDSNKVNEFITILNKKIRELNIDDKWSPLRDHEYVYLLALSLAKIGDSETKEHIKKCIRQEIQNGPLRRYLMFAASLRELGVNITINDDLPEEYDHSDIITLLWWRERYGGEKDRAWVLFDTMKDDIDLREENFQNRRRLSFVELALLYEAILREINAPSPLVLFRYYPIHEKLRKNEIIEKRFKNGDYSGAVFEAIQLLKEIIKEKSGVKKDNESELVDESIFGIINKDKGKFNFDKSKIIFNDHLWELSGRNEQEGLGLICKGVFKAFRNPKAHQASDHPLVRINPYDALDQLITISYLIKRIEKARVNK
jgi:uncharacterized protein (TIGR02391 family)